WSSDVCSSDLLKTLRNRKVCSVTGRNVKLSINTEKHCTSVVIRSFQRVKVKQNLFRSRIRVTTIRRKPADAIVISSGYSIIDINETVFQKLGIKCDPAESTFAEVVNFNL